MTEAVALWWMQAFVVRLHCFVSVSRERQRGTCPADFYRKEGATLLAVLIALDWVVKWSKAFVHRHTHVCL